MPFTFSHPAAVIPLAKYRSLILSGLIIGSMTPDFETFLRLSTHFKFAHTFQGILYFCIPVGLLIFLIFHHVLKFPLLWLLPIQHQQRLLPAAKKTFCYGSARQWTWILLSLIIGAFTHIAWDSVTHQYGWTVKKFPVLSAVVFHVNQHPVRLYFVLQHGGTIAGGILLAYWYWKWFTKPFLVPKLELGNEHLFSDKTKYQVIAVMAAGAGIAGCVYAGLSADTAFGLKWVYNFMKNAVIMGILSLFTECIVFGLYLKKSR